MADNENLGAPQSRNEALLQNMLGANYDLGEPQSRNEALLMKIAGEDVDVDFEPQSRIEALLMEIIDQGGGGGVEVEPLSVTENGIYTAETGKAYTPISVNVPNSYSASDEGKVVSNGALVAQSSDSVTQNGTVDTTLINSLIVNVPSNDDAILSRTLSGEYINNTVTKIGNYGLFNATNLTSFTGTSVTTLDPYAFQKCTNLVTVNLPSLSLIGGAAFRDDAKLETIIFPTSGLINEAGGDKFNGCSALTSFMHPNLDKRTNSGSSGDFYNCGNLTIADVGFRRINQNDFGQCKKLQTLILRSETLVSLSNSSAFTNTPFSGYNSLTGTLYVPQALVEDYKTATNWVTLFNGGHMNILPIEGSIYA